MRVFHYSVAMSKNILLIQNSNSNRNIVQLLSERDIKAVSVSTYAEAIEALKLSTPELILMDFCSEDRSAQNNQLARDLLGSLNTLGALKRIPVLVTGEDKQLLSDCAKMGVLVESNGECSHLANFASKILE